MTVIIEEVIAETIPAEPAETGRSSPRREETPRRRIAWLERRDLTRCLEQIEERRDRLDAE